jgi:mRNA interferase MazF
MRRGDVVRVHLPAPQGQPGREQFGPRPAIVIQGREGRYANLATVVLVPLTSKMKALGFAGTFRIDPSAENGLDVPSVALVHQIRAIDANRVQGTIGHLSDDNLLMLETEIRSLLGL